MDDEFNMSLRKFLKQVGVTSQQTIEDAIRSAGAAAHGKQLNVKMVLTIDEIGMTHTVDGKIKGPAA